MSEHERHAVVGGCDAGVRPGGDDREPVALSHGGEQERPSARKSEQVLLALGSAGPLALDPLGHVPLVEGANRDEAAALRYSLRPHATPAQAQLLGSGLYARVKDGVQPAAKLVPLSVASETVGLSFSKTHIPFSN